MPHRLFELGACHFLCGEAALISTRLQPGVEWMVPENGFNRFLGVRAFGKPLKRLRTMCGPNTGLKPGVNETCTESVMRLSRRLQLAGLLGRFGLECES
jgi:hypothetical protein